MTTEISTSSAPEVSSVSEPKVDVISWYSKLIMLINGLLIIITLMIGWVLWLTIARDAIDNYLKWFNDELQVNSGLQISFKGISIIVFTVVALTLVLMIPFIFIKTKNGIAAFLSLVTFIFSAIFIIGLIVFLIVRFETFCFLFNKEDGDATNTTGNLIIVFLPWILVALFAMILLVDSLYLTINITSKYKSNASLIAVSKPKINPNPVIASQTIDDKITIPTVVQTTVPENEAEQPITITVTNITTFPQQETNDEIINNDATIKTVNYSNHELSQVPIEGAYPSEAVSPTADVITNLSSPPITNQQPSPAANTSEYAKNDDLPAAPTTPQLADNVLTTTNTITTNTSVGVTNYQPKNQGGFDIQGNSELASEVANVNQQPAAIATDDYQAVTSKPKIEKEIIPPSPSKQSFTEQKVTNYQWTLAEIEAVWEKGEVIDGVSDKLYRKDYGGAWMFRDSFTNDYAAADNLETYSWTIVLHRPANQQGTTELYNLDPMNIVNAKSKGGNYPYWKTKITAKGNKNIIKEQNWKART